jgi:hypothetical protein
MMGWKLSDLTAQTGSPFATFRPAAYLFAQNTRHVVYQGFTAAGGSDGHLYELYWDEESGAWHYKDLTAEAEAPLATAYPTAYIFASNGTQHVLYEGQGDDGHVHELYWDSDGWHPHDLTDATGAPLALSVPTGYEFYAEGTQHVVYLGRDRHIHELWWANSSNGWQSGDLTAVTGAPVADSAPSAYMFDSEGTQHVIFQGTDSHIHELWWDSTGWHHNDLTAATGAPLASDEPTGYVFRSQSTQHVNYRGTDGHIHELWWEPSGWQHFNLTAATGAPLAYAGFRPTGYGFDAQATQPAATQHVDYVGTDSHIHELWWNASGWRHNDLTAATGAPLSISNPAGYVFVEQATQHVVYNAENHHIIELSWRP